MAGQEPKPTNGGESVSLKTLEELIKSVRFGIVQLIIQDGKIVQIDKTEKIRLV